MRLAWDEPGEKFFEIGTDRGVLFPETGPGVAWNGLVSVSEDVSGGAVESYYIDGLKYIDHVNNEDFQASIEAFSAPKEFAASNGDVAIAAGLYATLQPRKTFDLCYRTLKGDDTVGPELGYKLHLIYNVTAGPTSKAYKTQSKTVDPSVLKWTLYAVPPSASTYKPTAHLIVDSTELSAAKMTSIENILYGTVSTNPRMPTQAELVALIGAP